MPRARTRPATLGFGVHIGWAALVAVSGPPGAPDVVAKRRVVMATTFEEGAVYHAARALAVAQAEARVRASERTFVAAARATIGRVLAELRALGLEPAEGRVVGGGRPLPALETILRSHALVHAAEGALYRRVVAAACEACGVAAALVPPAGLPARVARAAGVSEARVVLRLAEMGKASGPPWTRDQKEAALAAWEALARANG